MAVFIEFFQVDANGNAGADCIRVVAEIKKKR